MRAAIPRCDSLFTDAMGEGRPPSDFDSATTGRREGWVVPEYEYHRQDSVLTLGTGNPATTVVSSRVVVKTHCAGRTSERPLFIRWARFCGTHTRLSKIIAPARMGTPVRCQTELRLGSRFAFIFSTPLFDDARCRCSRNQTRTRQRSGESTRNPNERTKLTVNFRGSFFLSATHTHTATRSESAPVMEQHPDPPTPPHLLIEEQVTPCICSKLEEKTDR
ncbi:hypothetical protein C8R46DRAFT_364267 [Mycena filopes]|nr:hypothetical protein C8R46DRAFT_364267 [Mycena filopes]